MEIRKEIKRKRTVEEREAKELGQETDGRRGEGGEKERERERYWETFREEDTETDRNSRSGEPVRHRRRSVFTQCEILVR